MPRPRDTIKLALRQEKEKVRLAQTKMDVALVKVDELGRRYIQEVDKRIKLIQDTTDKKLLNMKWSDFLELKIDKIADYPGSVSPSIVAPRSRSVSHKKHKAHILPRAQSLDSTGKGESPPLSFQRWPRAGEPVLSKAGSPLALPKLLVDSCVNVQIPTSKGVITVKSHKMVSQVKREVLMALDKNTIDQVKRLTANLDEIVNMANQLGQL